MKRYSEHEKQGMIRDWHSSNQSKKTWCKENGITVETLYNWLDGNSVDTEPDVTWAQVAVIDHHQAPVETGGLEIQFGNVIKVKLREGLGRESFRMVCEELMRIC